MQLTIFTPLSQKIVDRIKETDLNRISPMDALNLLHETEEADGVRMLDDNDEDWVDYVSLGFRSCSSRSTLSVWLMRGSAMKLSVFCGVNSDGFLARPDHALDFLEAGRQALQDFEEVCGGVDVVVVGRKTR